MSGLGFGFDENVVWGSERQRRIASFVNAMRGVWKGLGNRRMPVQQLYRMAKNLNESVCVPPLEDSILRDIINTPPARSWKTWENFMDPADDWYLPDDVS